MIFIKILNKIIQMKNISYFCGMIADMLSNKRLNPIVTELFIRGRKLNISIVLLHNLILLFKKILD